MHGSIQGWLARHSQVHIHNAIQMYISASTRSLACIRAIVLTAHTYIHLCCRSQVQVDAAAVPVQVEALAADADKTKKDCKKKVRRLAKCGGERMGWWSF